MDNYFKLMDPDSVLVPSNWIIRVKDINNNETGAGFQASEWYKFINKINSILKLSKHVSNQLEKIPVKNTENNSDNFYPSPITTVRMFINGEANNGIPRGAIRNSLTTPITVKIP